MTQASMSANDRHIASFVWKTMGSRGLACSYQDILTGVSELVPEQVAQIYAASLALAKGGDEEVHFDLLRALRLVSAVALRHALHDHGIEYRTELLLQHGAAGADRHAFLLACRHAQGDDNALATPALALLRDRVGSLAGAAPDSPVLESSIGALLPLDEDDDEPAAPTALSVEPPAAPAKPAKPTPKALGALPATAPAPAAQRRQCKVFGQSAALTWEIAALADQEPHQHPLCTVMIEAAAGDGAGRYRWDEKVVFMLTLRELPQVLCVLMGWSSELEFKFHGKLKRKALVIEHQDHGLHVRLTDGRQRFSVPVLDADRYPLCMLVLSALCANEPTLDAQAVLAVCRAMALVPVMGVDPP